VPILIYYFLYPSIIYYLSAKNSDNTNEIANTDDEMEEIDRPAFEGIFVELKKK
jgi:hypothetical protein